MSGSNEAKGSKNCIEYWCVSDVLKKRDGLTLALVQRPPVWKEEQVARLLDSLLRGYPIGSLLLVSAEGLLTCRLLDYDPDSGRLYNQPTNGSEALLDGQQRILAICSLFAGWRGADFRLNLVQPIPDADLANLLARRQKDPQVREYIWWSETERPDPPDGVWLRLNAVSKKLDDLKQVANRPDPAGKLNGLLEILSPNGNDGPAINGNAQRDNAAKMAAALLHALFDEVIPVQHVRSDKVADVLHIYSRLNLAGTPVTQSDVFFAAVKTRWSEADKELASLCNKIKLVDQMVLLRTLARMARVQLSEGNYDLLPLSLDSLNGEGGKKLIGAIQELAGDESIQKCWQNWAEKVKGQLGYATNFINQYAWDLVLAHVAWSCCEIEDDYVKKTISFMLGTTAFRYYTVFRNQFGTLAMKVIYEKTRENPSCSFPENEIVEECKALWQNAEKGTSRLRRADEWQTVVNENACLFLSILQGLKSDATGFDWDHIFPLAGKRYMQMKEEGQGRPNYAVYHDRVGWAGNLAAVPSSINREVQDRLPDEKLDKYGRDFSPQEWKFAAGETAAARMAMTEEEWDGWIGVAKSLKELHEQRAQDAPKRYNRELKEIMKRFNHCVENRQKRMWQWVEDSYSISRYASWQQNATER